MVLTKLVVATAKLVFTTSTVEFKCNRNGSGVIGTIGLIVVTEYMALVVIEVVGLLL